MTPDAQRVAITEAVGWKRVRNHWEKGEETVFCNDNIHHAQLPNYPEDLNAIAQAVAAQPKAVKHAYAVILGEMVSGLSGWNDWRDTLAASEATAQQRCEALLKALGKWE